MNTLHLPIERLADLADGVAAPQERDHLNACVSCARELQAYRTLVGLAADERRRIGPPSTNWDSLRRALDAEGLIAAPGRPVRRATGRSLWLRAAAMVGLVAGGMVLGRLSAGLSGSEALAIRSGGPVAEQGTLQAVSNGGAAFSSPQEALDQLERAQRAYEEAAAYLSAPDAYATYDRSDQYRTRLAALDMASETFQRALTDAPEDPILNQYLMATMNAREATIRRIGTTLPASVRMGRF